jgi:hypothetical protein
LPDTFHLESIPVHVASVESDILAHRAVHAMKVMKAIEIVPVAKTRHASAIAWKLCENLGNFARGLIGISHSP